MKSVDLLRNPQIQMLKSMNSDLDSINRKYISFRPVIKYDLFNERPIIVNILLHTPDLGLCTNILRLCSLQFSAKLQFCTEGDYLLFCTW